MTTKPERDINQHPGETREAYRKRIVDEAPPLPDAAIREIRAAAREYWAMVDADEDGIPRERAPD